MNHSSLVKRLRKLLLIMGIFKDAAGKYSQAQREIIAIFDVGCEVMGRPAGGYWLSKHHERVERIQAGKRELARRERLQKQLAEFQEGTSSHKARPEKDWGWYSKWVEKDGSIHVMFDRHGNQTTSYPHVHLIHDEPGGEIRVILSRGPKNHPERIVLPGTASAATVDAAVAKLRAKL